MPETKQDLAAKLFERWWARYPLRKKGCRASAQDAFLAALQLREQLGLPSGQAQELISAMIYGAPEEAQAAAQALADGVLTGRTPACASRTRPSHYVILANRLGPYARTGVVSREDLERVMPPGSLARLEDLGAIRPCAGSESP